MKQKQYHHISLDGIWQLCLDPEKKGIQEHFESIPYPDTITLPNTISMAKKGTPDPVQETGYLTDPYHMEGYAWYRRWVTLPLESASELEELHFQLRMERTRISHIWIDGSYVGTCESLVAPHIYDLTPYIHSLTFSITIMISNTDYKIPGGHLTSPDTQTNWNGILGEFTLSWDHGIRLERPVACSAPNQHALSVTLPINNTSGHEVDAVIVITAQQLMLQADYQDHILNPDLFPSSASRKTGKMTDTAYLAEGAAQPTTMSELLQKLCQVTDRVPEQIQAIHIPPEGCLTSMLYDLTGHESLWSEYHPSIYLITAYLQTNDQILSEHSCILGQRSFTACNGSFMINGHKTFLRGKHDGMVFPRSGFAPMNVEGWLAVMQIARAYGINHYRYHTCCPPEAAFIAADLLGIYMQPELPFWGNFYGPEDEDYNREAQDFLRDEGYRMLAEYAHHPSYCMMSMGNELWGNPSAINELIGQYKAFRPHILYTQGSNNFQWTPNIQPNDDFFSGVRFTINRQIRGSYAMCDQPLGHVQVDKPGTRFHYEEAIHPSYQSSESTVSEDGTIEIQYGTGVKRVKLTEVQEELNPSIPVVSHEVGQYCTYPDYSEISKYTGVLQARNFEVFRERLEEKHLENLSQAYFENSGRFAAACYKDEIETAMRTPSLAGYQLLDLQDFPGQGTALVGVLNAFMESKETISVDDWREFCSDSVLQAEFDSYIVTAGQDFSFTATLAFYRELPLAKDQLKITLTNALTGEPVESIIDICPVIKETGRHILGDYSLHIPEQTGHTESGTSVNPGTYATGEACKWLLTVSLVNSGIHNHYTLWSYSENICKPKRLVQPSVIASTMEEARQLAKSHKKILLFLSDEENPNSIPGTYCTDFWCYPMFKSISESIGKEIPVGTLGLLIRNDHPALTLFPSETYSTPQWFSIVNASRSTILDDTEILPIVQTIDNFERNHRLGLLYELPVTDSEAVIVVCTSNLPKLMEEGVPEAGQLYSSLIQYILQE